MAGFSSARKFGSKRQLLTYLITSTSQGATRTATVTRFSLGPWPGTSLLLRLSPSARVEGSGGERANIIIVVDDDHFDGDHAYLTSWPQAATTTYFQTSIVVIARLTGPVRFLVHWRPECIQYICRWTNAQV